MLVESQVLSVSVVAQNSAWLMSKAGILFLGVLYFLFSLIVMRQINLMTETIITEGASRLRAFGIIHAGFALGIIMLLVGLLFG